MFSRATSYLKNTSIQGFLGSVVLTVGGIFRSHNKVIDKSL